LDFGGVRRNRGYREKDREEVEERLDEDNMCY